MSWAPGGLDGTEKAHFVCVCLRARALLVPSSDTSPPAVYGTSHGRRVNKLNLTQAPEELLQGSVHYSSVRIC